MKVAVPALATLDLSGQYIAAVPDFEPGIHSLKMIRASGKLDLVLAAVAESSQILHHVNVSSSSLADLGVHALCSVLEKTSIDCFEAANMRSVRSDELGTLLQSLNNKCRVLDLGGITFQNEVDFDFSVFSKFESLQTISLAYWADMTSGNLERLPSSITDLNLSGTRPDAFDFLKRLPHLCHLDLDGVSLTNDAQDALVAVLSEKKNLRIRINIAHRLPNEGTLSPEQMARIPIENNITFY